jgi:hypothetical protein
MTCPDGPCRGHPSAHLAGNCLIITTAGRFFTFNFSFPGTLLHRLVYSFGKATLKTPPRLDIKIKENSML